MTDSSSVVLLPSTVCSTPASSTIVWSGRDTLLLIIRIYREMKKE